MTEGLPSDIGFCLALDDEEEGRAWCIPMDSDERRTAPDGALAVWRTDDAGAHWRAQRKGLPQAHAYDIVYRHALDVSGKALVFGTTCGNLFATVDGGESWEAVANYLPPVHSVTLEA
ncbi:MAG: hypothetical protein HC813_01085 [Planctomycetes bacterium]|nr:hypothetical protein [Planctomycetota bacterium]